MGAKRSYDRQSPNFMQYNPRSLKNTEKKEMEFITPIDKVVGWVEKHNNLLYGRIAAGTVCTPPWIIKLQ